MLSTGSVKSAFARIRSQLEMGHRRSPVRVTSGDPGEQNYGASYLTVHQYRDYPHAAILEKVQPGTIQLAYS